MKGRAANDAGGASQHSRRSRPRVERGTPWLFPPTNPAARVVYAAAGDAKEKEPWGVLTGGMSWYDSGEGKEGLET